ncbi:MAG TPA: ABC transporter substrate-binding protein [Candidatus Acidoferrum sp.]|nr:ABC transporter substrate-binding protein [Candidatus Acidoferrum sp.]
MAAIVAFALVASASPAGAQPRVWRVGMLSPVGSRDANVQDFFVHALRDLGYVEGQNLVLDQRSSEGHPERLGPLGAEIVRGRPDVLFAVSPPAVHALRKLTTTIPIVALDLESDPLRAGVAASLGRPAGNVTGIYLDVPEIQGKWIELLREAVPRLSTLAMMADPAAHDLQVKATQAAARRFGIAVHVHPVRNPDELSRAFDAIPRQREGALVVLAAPLTYRETPRIVDFALKQRLPAISLFRNFPDAGGLMSYGVVLPELFARCARFVDRILKGARAGDVPIERPERFELVVNDKTAAAFGLKLPQSLLLRANEVLQ